MNDHEAQRIAHAANAMRPDWPTASVLTLIRANLMDRPRRDVAVALAWVACESGSHTPARVLESGPWWTAAAVAGDTTGRREPYDPATHCSVCSKADDHRHPDDHPFESAITRARRLAAEARRDLPRVERLVAGEQHRFYRAFEVVDHASAAFR